MLQPAVFDANAVFEEICERGREQGIHDHEGYRDLVEEILYEHQTTGGDLSDDSNVQIRVEGFMSRFDEYLEAVK